jgi:hypothetical protein
LTVFGPPVEPVGRQVAAGMLEPDVTSTVAAPGDVVSGGRPWPELFLKSPPHFVPVVFRVDVDDDQVGRYPAADVRPRPGLPPLPDLLEVGGRIFHAATAGYGRNLPVEREHLKAGRRVSGGDVSERLVGGYQFFDAGH